MVVGDRLWLFSQPPHGPPAPIQSLLLNNVPQVPQHITSLHPSVLARKYFSPTQNQGYNMRTSVSPQRNYNKPQFLPHFTSESVEYRFGSKNIMKASTNDHNSSDLASLESRFGNNGSNSILEENKKLSSPLLNLDSSSSSEIDFEN